MNLVNIFFILIVVITMLEGIHRGFMHSALSLGAFFLSVIASYLLYPVVSVAVKGSQSIFDFLLYYTEGAEKIASFSDSRLLIDQLTAPQVNSIISTSSISEPFTTLIRQNVASKAFAADGLKTLGEYFNMTMVCVVINILSFMLIYLLVRLVIAFVLGAVDYTVKLPELRQYDRTSGMLFGISRGVLVSFLFITVVPVVLLFVPVDKVVEYFQSSDIGMFLYNHNFFLHLISGVV